MIMEECLYQSPIGPLAIAEDGGAISGIRFGWLNEGAPPMPACLPATPLLKSAAAQLDEYFAGGRKAFSLPLGLRGAAFSLSVWSALMEIPYGETRSYSEVASMVGRPGAARAVGMANCRNPIPIIVPCHRVIGADGSLTGYAGGLATKRYLLELEGCGGFC